MKVAELITWLLHCNQDANVEYQYDGYDMEVVSIIEQGTHTVLLTCHEPDEIS